MAEIEKSIEELEQEVMAELQSADASDSPVNDIQEEEVIAEKKAPKNETKEVEDLGPAVTSPTDAKSASAKSGECGSISIMSPPNKSCQSSSIPQSLPDCL